MSCSVLITRCRHDDINSYLYYWTEQVVSLASEKGIQCYDIKGSDVTRRNIESYSRKNNPTLSFFNGHGNQIALAGHDDQIIVDGKSQPATKIIYARSCDAASVLGNLLVQKGLEAFIGYGRKFTLCFLEEYSTRPLQDPLAKHFLEPSNLVATTLIKGHTADEAHNRSQKAMYKNFRRLLSSEASDDEKYAARWLWANMRNQLLVGNPQAKAE